jgi:hypothetical protein
VAFLVLALAPGLVFAKAPKVSPDLTKVEGANKVDVIIQFTQIPTSYHFAKVRGRAGSSSMICAASSKAQLSLYPRARWRI